MGARGTGPDQPHQEIIIQSEAQTDYVVLLTQEGGTFAAHSNHPRIGTTHSPDLSGLRRSVTALVETLPDDVPVLYATSVPDELRRAPEGEEALAADDPKQAYKTVPGSERLPASSKQEQADGGDNDTSPAGRFRKEPNVDVLGLGQVTSPGAR